MTQRHNGMSGSSGEAQLVLVCGGRGQRMGKTTREGPKSLVPVDGKPLLERLVGTVARLHWSAAPPLVIVDHADTAISELVHRSLPSAVVVRQLVPDGVASAISLTLPYLEKDALVVLGDIVLDGRFRTPWPKVPAVGVWRGAPASATTHNFGVSIGGGRIRGFVEKPADPRGLVCGIGVYLLPRSMIEGFRGAPVNAVTGEREITGALEDALVRGAPFKCLDFEGFYWNVNTVSDREIVERHFAVARADGVDVAAPARAGQTEAVTATASADRAGPACVDETGGATGTAVACASLQI